MNRYRPRWPNLFIPGAPKSGTTSIAHWLAQHPEVLVSKPKEPGYFNDDYKDGPFRRRASAYRRLFIDEFEHKWFCDGTVDYLASKNAIPAISRTSSDARFIVALRNHADLAFSLHQEERVSGNELEPDFETAFHLSAERRAGKRIPITRPEPKKIDYEERIRMGAQLLRALECFDRNRFLLIDFDMIARDGETVWTSVCEFLEISETAVDLSAHNPRKNVSSVPMTVIRKLLRTVKRALGITRNFGLDAPIRSLASATNAEEAQLSEDVRDWLDKKYESDRQLLARIASSGPSLLAPDSWMLRG